MVAIARSLDARLLRERNKERMAREARQQAAAFRAWMNLGDRPLNDFLALAPQVPPPGQLNPVGRLYERERAEDPSLRPVDAPRLIARQAPPPPRPTPEPLPLPPPQPASGVRAPTVGPAPAAPVAPPPPVAPQLGGLQDLNPREVSRLGGLAAVAREEGLTPQELIAQPQPNEFAQQALDRRIQEAGAKVLEERFPPPGVMGLVRAATTSLLQTPSGESPLLDPVGRLPIIGKPLKRELEFLTTGAGLATAGLAPVSTLAGTIGGVALGTAGEAAVAGGVAPSGKVAGVGVPEVAQIIGSAAPAALVTGPGRALAGQALRRAPREVAEEVAPVAAREAAERVGARAAGEVAAEEIVAPSNVDKLTELVKSAKPVLRETAELRRRVRGRQAEEIRRGLAGAGSGEEAQARTLGALKGELPTAAFEPPLQSMVPAEVDSLKVMIRDHFNVRPQRSFSAAPTFVALDKVLGGNLPNNSELKLLEEVFGEDLVRSLGLQRSLPRKVFDEAAGALSLWRTFITGGEQSVAFRQAAIPGLNPLNLPVTARAIKRSLQAGFSNKEAIRIADELAARPEWIRLEAAAERSGRQLFTKFRGVADPLAREEGFTALERTMIGRLAKATPLLGQYLRFSERNAVTLLNSMRVELGAKYLKVLDNLSPSGVASAVDEEEAVRLAAVMTGRGKIPANEVGQIATRALFSAQLQASRIETPFLLLSKSPAVRKLAAQEIAGFMTFGLSVLAAAKLSGAADVELNSNSTDFGKIRIGPTRIDVWGGFQPYVRLVSQLATGQRKTSLGEMQDIGIIETLERFFTNKTAPAVNLAVDIRRGETGIGEPVEGSPEGIRRELKNRVTPLITQDVADAMQEHDSWLGAAITPLVWFGIGAQSYTTPSVRTAQLIGEDLMSGKLPDVMANPETYDEVPLKIGDLTPRDREAFLALHPDIEQGLEERSEEVVGGLSQREQAGTFGALAGQASDTVKEGLDTLTTDVQGGRFGDASEFDVRRTIWDQATDLFTERRGAIKNAEAVFEEQVARRGEREPTNEVQRTLNRFFEFTDRHGDLATDEEWTARDVAFEQEFSEAEQRVIEQQLGVGDHRIETERQRLSALLDAYYDIPAEPGRRREAYRRTHATEDAALWALGRVATVMTPAARSRAQGFWETLFQGPVSVPFRRGQRGRPGGGRLPPPIGSGGSTLPPPIGGR